MAKVLYKLMNKEDDSLIGWFTDSDELFYIIEWYGNIPTKYEKWILDEVVE